MKCLTKLDRGEDKNADSNAHEQTIRSLSAFMLLQGG
jgi:hypothetical protein